jgi:hypothetical protein
LAELIETVEAEVMWGSDLAARRGGVDQTPNPVVLGLEEPLGIVEGVRSIWGRPLVMRTSSGRASVFVGMTAPGPACGLEPSPRGGRFQ